MAVRDKDSTAPLRENARQAFGTDKGLVAVAAALKVAPKTLSTWWVEEFGEKTVRGRARRIHEAAQRAHYDHDAKRAKAKLAFDSAEGLRDVATRLGVHKGKLRSWWVADFGNASVEARGRKLIADSVRGRHEHGSKRRQARDAFSENETFGTLAIRLDVAPVTLKAWWVEDFGRHAITARAHRMKALAQQMLHGHVEKRQRARGAFYTDEGLAIVAKELGVTVGTLAKWWEADFGEDALQARRERHAYNGPCALYMAVCRPTGKLYFGITQRGFEGRHREHVWDADAGSTTRFHQAIREYGDEAFNWVLLDATLTVAEAKKAEKYLIQFYGTRDDGAGRKVIHSPLGN
jgi:transposase-like protein